MQIFVKAVSGKTLALELPAGADARALKLALEDGEGVPASLVTLVVDGRVLADDAELVRESIVEASIPLSGAGGKKRKKKVYTTPKVIKHKHKTEKLATLKFYKVDDDGKIVKQRLDCPVCGVGVFMALHHDRHYCGRCGRVAPREG